MIDHDLSDQLHSLAATMDEPFDMTALRRRITVLSRRRAAVKVGVAGAGAAAVVGGLIVVRDRPADSPLAAATAVTAPVATSVVAQAAPLPDCAVVLADIDAANVAAAVVVPKPAPIDTLSADVAESTGFKGAATIVAIEGQQITFTNDEPKNTATTDGVAMLDEATEWVDGSTPLDPAPVLQVGQHVGLATSQSADGIDHVLFVDIGTKAAVDDKQSPDDKHIPSEGAETATVVAGAVLPPGPTDKSHATITAADATSITVTLDEGSAAGGTVTIDLASALFYAGDTVCAPGLLTVGTSIGVAYHLADDGALVGDAVLVVD